MKVFVFLLLSLNFAFAQSNWVAVDNEIYQSLPKIFELSKQAENEDFTLLKMDSKLVEVLTSTIHHKFQRCGGFVQFDNEQEAFHRLTESFLDTRFSAPPLTMSKRVKSALSQVSEIEIREVILKLSSFRNRYYKSEHGVNSSLWIKKHWEKLSEHRSDVAVELFKHKWEQPSIVLTIKGNKNPEEIVILGGHADSIAGFFGRTNAHAPGADDNASGIATLTEIIRVAMESGYRPAKTVQFIAYAAEEVGLLGSREIAKKYKGEGKNVLGVVQMDMTNYKGTDDLDIILMSDYTNKDLNLFLGKLIDEYVKVPWGYSQCGYGCSDHASWTASGFAASFPHEATMKDGNHNIHTKRDTIEVSQGNATHAVNFSKLGLSFMLEVAK